MLAHPIAGAHHALRSETGIPENELPPAASSASTNFAAVNSAIPDDGGSNVPSNCTVHSASPTKDRDDDDEHDGEDGEHGHRHYYYDDGPNPPAPGIVASGFKIFGPQTYVRTNGNPNEFDASIAVPAWINQPFYLHVQNGDSDKKHRNSSATILINGVTVLGTSAFNEKVGSIDCAVSLPAQTNLHVTLASKPGSFLIISLLGQNTDHTSPQLAITAPANGAAVNTATPHLAISYTDLPGASEPAASGVNTETLQVLLDGIDRTSLFTKRPNEATADLPASLALSAGPHTLTATIKDNATNTAQAVSQFQVDLTPITIQIVTPAAGAFLNGAATQAKITYSDNLPIDPATLKVLINGVDKSALFTATTTQATAVLNPAIDLRQGANQIVATIRDQAGNQGTASVAFNVDVVPPVITILHPLPSSRHGSSNVEYSVEFTDDQAIDLTSLQITVDGNPLAATPTPTLATGSTILADGNHTLTAQIKDKAGNTANASSTFSVDTSAPDIHIIQPAAGTISNVASIPVDVRYGDNQSIDPASLHVSLDGVDKTASFTVTATSATGTLAGPLAEGPHTIAAQIADLTGNIGNASTTLLIDTIKPVLTIASPVGPVNTTTPAARANYSDSGSGINPASVRVFVDGSDVTTGFSIGSDSAAGIISAGGALTEGAHQLRVTVADRATNVADVSSSFVVDVTPPTAVFINPANNSFINTTQPTLTLDYSDAGSGVNTAAVHIFLQQGSAPEIEITSQFTLGPAEATATLSAANALAVGTYHLRAQVMDRAGNTTSALAAFQVDTTAPVYTIQMPAASSFINTATPTFLLTYHDDSSGVDPSKFAIRVDGIDRTNRLTAGDQLATGTLLPADALADGTHQVEVTVVDRAGNTADIVPQPFLVDTIAPAISVTTAAVNGFTNNNQLPITVSYSDAGSGIDITKFLLLIDGVDHAAEFTVTATGATGSPAIALSDGAHVVTATISDLAGNPSAPATTAFSVNTVAPLITITQPVDGTYTNAASIVVTGTVVSALPVTVAVEGVAALVQSGVFTSQPVILGAGPSQIIHVVATDSLGSSSTATVTVSIDRTPPTIVGTITPAPTAAGWNNSAVTVNFICSDAGSGVATCSGPVTFTTQGANQVATGTATDRVGNTAQASVTVNIDLTAPLITASAAPVPNAAGWNNTDVLVSYLCSDSLSGIAVCPPPTTVSTEGANVEVTGQAVDKAGNTSGVTTSLKIDKTPPLVTATAVPPPNGAGFNNSNVNVTFTCSDALSGVVICPQPQIVGTEGLNQNISGHATDAAGNVGTGSITLNIDKTPPTIVQLVAPDHISRLHSGLITVTANDNFSVAQVVISVNGTALGTFSSAPYQATLQVPLGSNPGDTLTVTAQATDAAGNTQTATRGVRVAADGVVVGQVLSDVTSFPIQGATVQMIGATSQSDQTDSRGRYSLPASDSHLFVVVSSTSPATTAVEREVFVQEGVGTVPVDARLTPLAPPVAMGSSGLTLTAGNIQVQVPAGAALPATTFQLTPISGQGLPGLLPLGWSPLAAFDLRASSAAANLSATFTHLPNIPAHLAFYNPALHAWTMIAPGLLPVSGTLTAPVPSPGAYALVVADVVNPPIAIPAVGDPLLGVAVQLLPPDATSTGSLNPAIVPPSGGTAMATLGIQTQTSVPSGTVIQANVSEKFSLKSGDAVSEESRSEDIILYGALAPPNSVTGALFPVTPARTFGNTELLTGKVHLDILAGREGVRGQPGGSDPLTLSDGTSTLSVPGGALSDDTAISVESSALEDFIPVSSTLSALQEILVDFSGETLNTPAQLSISATGLNPADTFLLTKVERLDGVPHIITVALAQINGASLTSISSPGLPGVITGGEYIFYDITAPVGLVQGTVSSSAGPVQAIVQTDSFPIVAISGQTGQYIVPALAGTANLKANAPHTALAGSASANVSAGQTTLANIVLVGVVTNAVVSPADGTLGVPASTVITITTTAPLNPQSIQQSNLVLLKGTAATGTPVAVQPFVLSSAGTTLSFAPQVNLDPATQYTIKVSGLADTFGGAVFVPVTTFTTKAATTLNFDPTQITFSFPDQNGNIHVSTPAGSLPPGTRVQIIDQTNGIVLSLTAFNDGSISGDFPGTINDRLQITVTDPLGASTSFTRSQFVAADGTVAVGSGGGTVSGLGGVELRIPDGALDKAASFKIEAFGPDLFPDRPPLDNANFGSGLRIESQDKPTFNKEIKLAFPKPSDAPDGAFYYVYRRLQGPDGGVIYETLDHAFVEGQGANAKVVTASPPFPGYGDSLGAYKIDALGAVLLESVFVNDIILMWTFNSQLPGLPLPGAVTGKVLRPRFIPGQPDPVFDPVPNVTVVPLDSNSRPIYDKGLGTSQADGKFTFFAPFFVGGTVGLQACDPVGGKCYQAKAFEVSVIDTKTIFDFAGPLFKYYRNVAAANITFAPLPPAQPAPQLTVSVAQRNADGSVSPVNGIIQAGTTLVVSVKTNAGTGTVPTVTGGTIQGQNFGVKPDPSDPAGFVFDPDFTVPQPGTYKITATALPPLGGNPISASYAFLAIGPGGSNSNVVNDQAPDVVTALLVPKPDAKSVPTTTFPQIVFTEPVNNVPSNLSLLDLGPAPQGADCSYTGGGSLVSIKLSGVAVIFDAQNNPTNVPVDTVSDGHSVTSVTVIPQEGLKFNNCYKISLQNGITDLDKDANGNPAPKHLAGTPPARDFGFQTFGPEQLSSAGGLTSPRVGIIGNKAYTVQPLGDVNSQLVQYDISDPTAPTGPVLVTGVPGRAVDLGVEESSPDTGGGLVAVATGAGILAMPSNIFFYDASDPASVKRIGAVSVTGSAGQEGTILKMVLKDSFAYTSTHRKGIQVVDIRRAIANYIAAVQSDIVQFGFQVSQDGEGFGRDAVVNTIDVETTKFGGSVPAALFDLKVGDYVLDQQGNPQGQVLVLATGMEALAVVDPLAGQVMAQISDLTVSGTTLVQGSAIALGSLTAPCPSGTAFNVLTCNVAVVGGRDATGVGVLMLVDLTDPRNPVAVSSVRLDEIPTDIVMRDNLALVGLSTKVQIVDFTSPTSPQLAGIIAGVGGKLALTDSGLLFSTGLLASQAGLHISTFQPTVVLPPVAPVFSTQVVSGNQTYIQTLVKLTLNPRVIAAEPKSGIIEIFDGAVKIAEQTFQFVKNTGQVIFDKGLQLVTNAATGTKKFFTAKITALTDRGPLTSQRQILAGGIHIVLDFNNDTLIDDKDTAIRNSAATKDKAFAFWEGDRSLAGNGAQQTPEQDSQQLVDFARVRIVVDAIPDVTTANPYLKLKGVTDWELMKNLGITDAMTSDQIAASGKLYLSDKTVSLNQVKQMNNRAFCNDLGTNVLNVNCLSSGDSIILAGLAPNKTYELLFRCFGCPKDPTRTLSIVVRDKSLLGSSTDGDTVNVDIRPIKDWVGAYSARESDPPDPVMAPVNGWSNSLPSNANVTVLVHGFAVSEDNGLTSFIPKYVKRLYWSGHQVLPAQNYPGTDQTYANATVYTVGLLWHGDFKKVIPGTDGLFFPDDEFRALQSGVPFAAFFNQLKASSNTTTVIAHSLGNMAVNSALTRPNLLPGAVKQYMMNDAAVPLEAFTTSDVFATDPQIPPGSEQFQANIFKQNRKIFMQGHLAQEGFPDDGIWNNLLQQILPLPFTNCINGQVCLDTAHGVFDNFYNARPIADRNTHYVTRWRKQRPGKVAPPNDSSLQTGPWNGFFANNLNLTDMYNSFNVGDCVLNNPWFANELFQKPDRGPLASISDTAYVFSHRNGGPFPVDKHTNASDNDPDTVHSSTDSLDNQSWLNLEPPFPSVLLGDFNSHYGIHRQWTELAYWYPAGSAPVGVSDGNLTDQTVVFKDGNHVLNFTGVGELDSGACFTQDTFATDAPGAQLDAISFLTGLGSHTETHSYMLDKPFWQTWWAYKQYFFKLDQGRKDPDPAVNAPAIH
jgi:hypothetical protein